MNKRQAAASEKAHRRAMHWLGVAKAARARGDFRKAETAMARYEKAIEAERKARLSK